MSESMLTRMVGCEFSYQIWDKLEAFFSSQTKAKVLQLKTQLRNLKKGSLSVNEYLLKLKKIIDSLFSVGASISEPDHIEAILEGLPEEYNSFIVSVTSRSDPYTVNQIENLLLAQEERLDKYKKDSNPTLSANLAQSSAASKNSKPPSSSNTGQSKFIGNAPPQQGRFSNFRGSNRGGRGRGGKVTLDQAIDHNAKSVARLVTWLGSVIINLITNSTVHLLSLTKALLLRVLQDHLNHLLCML